MVHRTPIISKSNLNIVEVNDKKYVVKRVMPSDNMTDDKINAIKELWACDTVLKKQGNHYFCVEISDTTWEDVYENVPQMRENV